MTVKAEDHREQSAVPPQEQSRVREATPSRERQEEEATPPQERRRKKIGRNARPSPGVLVGPNVRTQKAEGWPVWGKRGKVKVWCAEVHIMVRALSSGWGLFLMLVGFVSLGE